MHHVIFPKQPNVFCALAMVFCHLLTAGFRVIQGWAWIVTSVQDSLQASACLHCSQLDGEGVATANQPLRIS